MERSDIHQATVNCRCGIWILVCLLPLGLVAQSRVLEEQRVRETLRNTILDRERSGAAAKTNSLSAELRAAPAFVAMERRYLDGEITARQFQRFIREFRASPPIFTAPSTNSPQQVKAIAVLRAVKEPTNAVIVPHVSSALPEKDPAEPMSLSDVEAKVEELWRKKAERTRPVQTNAVPADLINPQSPLNKRQRLDALLRLYIDGVIDDATYQTNRAQVVNEP